MHEAGSLDVVCVGETLVDFLPVAGGASRVRDVEAWRPSPGGSPANVSVGLARLGLRSAMVGVVGADEFGHFLRERLAADGVDVSRLRQVDHARTGLLFVSLDARGERTFTYFRTRSAEFLLDDSDVDGDFVRCAKAVHCGSNSLLLPEAREAMVRMLTLARDAGMLVSCDPNLRLHVWSQPEELRVLLGRMLPLCTVVKLSEEEVSFATGATTPEDALRVLAGQGVRLPVVTLGERGAVFLWRGEVISIPAPQVTVVDTTGAGDGFVSAMLHGLVRWYGDARSLEDATREELSALMAFAASVGARVVTKLGALAALPLASEVEGLLPVRPPRPDAARRAAR
ncbi:MULTISPECIES: carbohydrate kinase [Corallococcus]|uniref:carbohydrate kinase family protein n=1 Tax=Corallococcus TaxID=83461 RepID=UPI00117C7B37|nr:MULTISPECIES: carbohydrate kinase [Corallococcus]NBD09592.1 carbohydrate kinase [Corallococcus silvisoli]TSC31538.1 carbohydrate kinase [Corallococcus sp. Z5C101001]